MKKILCIFFVLLLTGCSVRVSELTPEDYPVIIYNGEQGYVIGDVVGGEIVEVQENGNYSQSAQSGAENYTLFDTDGNLFEVEGELCETQLVYATGTYETQVILEENGKMDNERCYIGLGLPAGKIKETPHYDICENDSFELDFDKDGRKEIISVNKGSGTESVIRLENQEGKSDIAMIDIDGVYTSGFDLFVIDVDQDGGDELIICRYGHNYSVEIYKIESKDYQKALGYYMGN